jgi:hypothetical protein
LELGLRLSGKFSRDEQSSLLMRIAATERRFIMRADEKLTAFVELESVMAAAKQLWRLTLCHCFYNTIRFGERPVA